MSIDRGAVAKRLAFAIRMAPILIAGLFLALFVPGVAGWLTLPADSGHFFARPYSLLTYWVISSSASNLIESLLGLALYGAVIQPRISDRMQQLAAISVLVGGVLFVALAKTGILVSSLPIVAGFAGATMRIWWDSRHGFARWEHAVTALAAFGTSMALFSALSTASNLIAVGTAAAGAVYAHVSLRRSAA